MKLDYEEFATTYNASKKKKILLDVRNPDELRSGSFAAAKNIPIPQLSGRYHELDDQAEIYIFCKMGGRAERAYDFLQDIGIVNLYASTSGGFSDLEGLIDEG